MTLKVGPAVTVALTGSILGFALLIASIPVRERLAEAFERGWDRWVVPAIERAFTAVEGVVRQIREARNQKPRAIDPEHLEVFVPIQAGPVVETAASPNPLPLSAVPVRSTKADAKRAALAYARKRTGNPNLQWKAARHLMNKWERDERAKAREQDPEYVARMRELEEASA